MNSFKDWFQEFLSWDECRGLHRLCEDFEMWALFSPGRTEALQQCCQQMEESDWQVFTDWLVSQFKPDELPVVFQQILTLLPSLSIAHYYAVFECMFNHSLHSSKVASLHERPKTFVVLLREGGPNSKDDIKQMVAIVVPNKAEESRGLRVYALNFHTDGVCDAAMNSAGEACLRLFPLRILHPLGAYLLGGNILPVSLFYAVRSFWRAFRWWRLLRNCRVYVYIEGMDGLKVDIEGPSMGLSVAVAILTALSKISPAATPARWHVRHTASRQSVHLPLFIERMEKSLARSGFTGKLIETGEAKTIGRGVDKIAAFNDCVLVKQGFLPKGNRIRTKVRKDLSLVWTKSLSAVLIRLADLWKWRWFSANSGLFIICIAIVIIRPYVIPQEPRIVRGYTWQGPLGSVNNCLVGDAAVIEEVTLIISAKRFKPPLWLEIEPQIGFVASSYTKEYQIKEQILVLPDGTGSFIYSCSDFQPPPQGEVISLRFKNYCGKQVGDVTVLFLRIIQ
jgi:hypothetical protein